MKLNPDCIRDILLSVEDSTDSTRIFRYSKDSNKHERLSKYDHNTVYYHMKQCNMSDYFVGYQPCDAGDLIIIRDLTPKAHEFIANIRKNPIWEKIKDIADEVGSDSVSALGEIARLAILQIVRNHFGIT